VLRRLLNSPWTYFALAAALAVLALTTQLRFARPPLRPVGDVGQLATLRERKPNVVFVLIDMLRADRLSAYGYERSTSPTLKVLADGGVRFARVEAQSSWTKTSMASLWTGVFPTRTGVLRYSQALSAEATLPAEIFRAAGYATAGIWRNGWVDPTFGFQQGFQTYLRPVASPDPRRFQKRSPHPITLAGNDEDATRTAVGFLDSLGGQPFFLYVHYMDVHQFAYDEVAARLDFGTSQSDAYDAAIHWVDRNVAALVAALARRKLLANTIVVIASDHGEALGEGGREGHAQNLYGVVTEVPWILALPFRLERGVVVEQTVRNVDIWPTVLDLAGLPPLPRTDGRSLVPVIESAAGGAEDGGAPASYAYLDRSWGHGDRPSSPTLSVRDGSRRLILSQEPGGSRKLELFDLEADPDELQDLSESRREWIEELLPGLEETQQLTPAWGDAPEVELNELTREMLRALGYAVK
jgi:arylsulfatase A-like enzyme